MNALLTTLKQNFPDIQFAAGQQFCWSPELNLITFKTSIGNKVDFEWSLLHEVGHALLHHKNYASDFELVQLEVAAWDAAKKLAREYDHTIDDDYVQDCLDTYREWLHLRSTCPTCGIRSLQQNTRAYACFNCKTVWHVSTSRFCRPYRRLHSVDTKESPAPLRKQAIFI